MKKLVHVLKNCTSKMNKKKQYNGYKKRKIFYCNVKTLANY